MGQLLGFGTPRTKDSYSGRVVSVVATNAEAGALVTVPLELLALGNENTLGFSVVFDPNSEVDRRFWGAGSPRFQM